MRFLFTLSALFLSLACFAQIPGNLGIGFQGYARKADGSAISNESIRVKFSVYDKGLNLTAADAEFTETHNVQTDAYGVFTAEIGTVSPATFNALDFSYKFYAMSVEVSVNGGNFVTISDKAFNIVPYARAAGNGVPTGTIMPFGGNADRIPEGWVACNGVSYDPNDPKYSRLFYMIGFNWGNDNGNFRVPQLEGVFLRGVGGTQNNDPDRNSRIALGVYGRAGNVVGSYQNGEIKSHNHGVNDPGHNHNAGGWDRLLAYTGTGTAGSIDNTGSEPNIQDARQIQARATGITIQNTGGSETRPINAAVLYIIKL